MLAYDSTHGPFKGEVSSDQGSGLKVNNTTVKFFSEKDPSSIPWRDAGADYIIESTGVFKSVDKAQGHLHGGAKKVLITAPSPESADVGLWRERERI